MKFEKYPSIENSYREKTLGYIRMNFPLDTWCVTEKIHGSNMSFWCDREGFSVHVAKRSGWIGQEEDFFGSGTVIKNHETPMRVLMHDLLMYEDDPDILGVVVYGELFGKGIQKGIQYIEDKDFVAYNWGLVRESTGVELFPVEKSLEYLESKGFKTLRPLFIGHFEDCLNFDIEINSQLANRLSWKEFEVGENIQEGVVIKPYSDVFLDTHGRPVMLKKKTQKFSEKSKSGGKQKSTIRLHENQKIVLEKLTEFLNENRVYSAISKIGTPTQKDFGKLMGETMKDILEEYEKEHGQTPKKELGDDWKNTEKVFKKQLSNTVRDVFLKEIE